MNKKIKWVIFDVAGTIIHLTFTNPHGYKINGKQISQKEIESLYYTEEYKQYMLGFLSHFDFVEKFLKKSKINISVAEFNKLLKDDITPVKGMVELITDLSKKYRIALATNEGDVFSKYKIDGSKTEKYISKIITSWKLHEIKPSPLFFEKMLSILGAKPQECVFIDDVEINVLTAKKMRITAIKFINLHDLTEEIKRLSLI